MALILPVGPTCMSRQHKDKLVGGSETAAGLVERAADKL